MKSFNEFLNESTKNVLEIDATSNDDIDDIISVDLSDNKDGTCFIQLNIGHDILIYRDIDINPKWYEDWSDDKRNKMYIVYKNADEKVYELFKEMIIKSKLIIKEASEEVNKLDENWKRYKKYNL